MDETLKWNAEAARVKREELVEALKAADGNVTRAARAVGLSRRQATNLVKAFGLGDEARKLRTAAYNRKGGMGRPPKGRTP